MAREVRITIDDDEVFERMKARKRDLDLSWKEVLHRGLREEPDPGHADEFGRRHPGQRGHQERGHGSERRQAERGTHAAEPGSGLGNVVDSFQAQLRDHVREQVRTSMESSLDAMGGNLEREMYELEAAEDAVLRFDFLPDDRTNAVVPLRVTLHTGRGGLDVDVVAVRQGKSVEDSNQFTRDDRRRINVELAQGNTATLEFDDVETYDVAPVLAWTRDRTGQPIVDDVEIAEVLIDGER